MELFRVQLLRRMFEMGIVLVFDLELLEKILGWKIGEAFQFDDRYGIGCLQNRSRLRRVSISRLEIDQGLIVVRSVPWNGDRKSTRLNSSHSQISYAVFCLKK